MALPQFVRQKYGIGRIVTQVRLVKRDCAAEEKVTWFRAHPGGKIVFGVAVLRAYDILSTFASGHARALGVGSHAGKDRGTSCCPDPKKIRYYARVCSDNDVERSRITFLRIGLVVDGLGSKSQD